VSVFLGTGKIIGLKNILFDDVEMFYLSSYTIFSYSSPKLVLS
jgi:hypothetical protein